MGFSRGIRMLNINIKEKVSIMQNDSFKKSIYHQLASLSFTIGLSLKVYQLLIHITSPVEIMNGALTSENGVQLLHSIFR